MCIQVLATLKWCTLYFLKSHHYAQYTVGWEVFGYAFGLLITGLFLAGSLKKRPLLYWPFMMYNVSRLNVFRKTNFKGFFEFFFLVLVTSCLFFITQMIYENQCFPMVLKSPIKIYQSKTSIKKFSTFSSFSLLQCPLFWLV
jgi:hypothetical protein